MDKVYLWLWRAGARGLRLSLPPEPGISIGARESASPGDPSLGRPRPPGPRLQSRLPPHALHGATKGRTRGAEGPAARPEPSTGDQRRLARAPGEARAHGPGRGARRGGTAGPGGPGVRRGRGQEPHRRSPEAGAAADPQLLGRMRFRVTSERSRERRWPGGAKSEAQGEWAVEAVVAGAGP